MKKHILQENYERFFGKREFGDPLPTFEDVMEKHQVNKLEEGWWENMSDAAQKAYIKKYGEAPGSAGGDEDDYDMGEVPGSRGTGPWTPEDDPDFEKGPSLTSAPGRVPDEDDEDDYDMGGDDRVPNQDFRSDPTDDDYSVYDDPELARIPDEDDEESSGRTGNELSRETLMINGKQYNRISEGVEQKSKPKYAFSEFYQRFKKQE